MMTTDGRKPAPARGFFLLRRCACLRMTQQQSGAIAQLGERLNGIQEVRGSTPLGSTK